jgi:hypothetical protein
MSTAAIREALRKRYAMPEYVLMEEVRDGAGFSSKRSADAVAMGTWPSRGLNILGFEIKAHRSDWLRELKDPAKADPIARYCDFWIVATVPGVVKEVELPATWGCLELRSNGMHWLKEPVKNAQPAPLDRSFVAAMMRRCGELDERRKGELIAAEILKAHADAKQDIEREVKDRSRELEELKARLAKVKEATGLDFTKRYGFDTEGTIKALNFALAASDLTSRYGGLLGLKRTLSATLKSIDEALPLLPGHEPNEAPT